METRKVQKATKDSFENGKPVELCDDVLDQISGGKYTPEAWAWLQRKKSAIEAKATSLTMDSLFNYIVNSDTEMTLDQLKSLLMIMGFGDLGD